MHVNRGVPSIIYTAAVVLRDCIGSQLSASFIKGIEWNLKRRDQLHCALTYNQYVPAISSDLCRRWIRGGWLSARWRPSLSYLATGLRRLQQSSIGFDVISLTPVSVSSPKNISSHATAEDT